MIYNIQAYSFVLLFHKLAILCVFLIIQLISRLSLRIIQNTDAIKLKVSTVTQFIVSIMMYVISNLLINLDYFLIIFSRCILSL